MLCLEEIETLKFKQECRYQVSSFMQSWTKKNASPKMHVFGIDSTYIIHKIMNSGELAESMHRYDFDRNDLNPSINEFYFSGEKVVASVATPAMLVFKHSVEDRREPMIVHVISDNLAFISAAQEEVAGEFLASLVEHAGKHEAKNPEKGPAVFAGGNQ